MSWFSYVSINSRASHKLLEHLFSVISQKVIEMLLKKRQKLLFVTKVAQKFLQKKNNNKLLSSFSWSDAKYDNCTATE